MLMIIVCFPIHTELIVEQRNNSMIYFLELFANDYFLSLQNSWANPNGDFRSSQPQ